MEVYPANFNRAYCRNLIDQTQSQLKAQFRQNLYTQTVNNTAHNIKYTAISFSPDMDYDCAGLLCEELLERFNDVKITVNVNGLMEREHFCNVSQLKQYMCKFVFDNYAPTFVDVTILNY